MSNCHANSSPELLPQSVSSICLEEHTLEGVATNIQLLLKLVQDHKEVGHRDDGRRMQRVAGMMTILDDVKHRIQKSQSFGKKSEAQLRRCNTEVRRTDKRPPPPEPITKEEQRLRKELSVTMAARKNLEKMFSSLGKEKEIIATELARKVQELNDTEEHLSDLRAQNEKLLAKVKLCAAEHKERCGGGREAQDNVALQERNKVLSENVLKSLDGYRSLKRKLKDAQEENEKLYGKMGEMAVGVRGGLNKIHEFRQHISEEKEQPSVEIEEELLALENLFLCFVMKVSPMDCLKRGNVLNRKPKLMPESFRFLPEVARREV